MDFHSFFVFFTLRSHLKRGLGVIKSENGTWEVSIFNWQFISRFQCCVSFDFIRQIKKVKFGYAQVKGGQISTVDYNEEMEDRNHAKISSRNRWALGGLARPR